MRRQKERKGSALIVPYPVIVAGDDAECVIARPEVGVIGHAPVTRFNPIPVTAVQTVPEPDFFRRHQAVGGVMDFKDTAASGLQFGGVVRVQGQSVHKNLLDDERRRQVVECDSVRIDHHHAVRGGEPKAAIKRFAGVGLIFTVGLAAQHAVGDAVGHIFDFLGGPIGHSIQLRFGNPVNTPVATYPEIALPIFQNVVSDVVKQTLIRLKPLHTAFFQPVQPIFCSDPKHSLLVFVDAPRVIIRQSLSHG